MSPLPLDGILVVALEQAVAAPLASRQLADLGARVIKVERPDGGDFARGYDTSVLGQSSYFVWLNRGKQSVTLDIKDPNDRRLLDNMIARADVFLHNLAPSAIQRLGLDGDALAQRHPTLITCGISGYGEGGPYRAKKAYDLLVQCEAGLLSVTGTGDEPAKSGISVADIAAGMYAFSGILTALYQRERTGAGSVLTVAMLEALGEWMMQPFYYTKYGDRPPLRTGARHASIAPYGPYRTADGTIFLGVQNDREWVALCRRVIGHDELVDDPRFARNPDRVAHDAELKPIIERALAGHTSDDVAAMLDEVGIANARMRAPSELAGHPQLTARQRWADVTTPNGTVRALRPPVQVGGQTAATGPVPALGADDDLIRAEFGRK